MTARELRDKWEARLDEWSRLELSARLGPIVVEFLADLDSVDRHEGTELLNLTQASIRSGLSADHLGRLVRTGKLQNYGRKNAPRVRAADLRRKMLPSPTKLTQLGPASRQQARTSNTPTGGE